MTKRWIITLCLAALLLTTEAVKAGNLGSTPFDTLDGVPEPSYQVDLSWSSSSDYQGLASGSIVELDADWEMAYYQLTEQSDLDLRVAARITFLTGAGDLDLPSLLARAALDAGWTWDFAPDYALCVRVYPGLYTDLAGLDIDSLCVPLAAAVRRSLHPQLSLIAGLEYRGSFEDNLMPIIGADWEITEASRLRIGLPETRADIYLTREWSFACGLAWENTSYYLHDTPDRFTVESIRWYVGVTRRLTDQLELDVRLGGTLDRTVAFGTPNGQGILDLDVSDGRLVSMGLRGPF